VAVTRIGIDATCWWNRRGFGRFTRGLLQSLFQLPGEHQFVLFIDHSPPPEMQRDNIRIVQLMQRQPVTQAAVASGNRSPLDLWQCTRRVAAESLDVMFFPAVYSWFPVSLTLPTVVTLHDAIAERFPKLIFPGLRARLLWTLKVKLALWQAKRVMTVSLAAKSDIITVLGVAPNRIDVISEAASTHFRPIEEAHLRAHARTHCGLPEDGRYLIYVGGLAPHKNLSGLLRGFSLVLETGEYSDIFLILVGDPKGDGFHTNHSELENIVRANPRLRRRVYFTGFVPDEQLSALYSDGLAAVLPSFCEGFGLPAIEAMACGTPVLASNTGALPEVIGDAGLYFDPHDPEQIAATIRRVVDNPETLELLRQRALLRAQQFTWEKSAQATLQYLLQCARNG